MSESGSNSNLFQSSVSNERGTPSFDLDRFRSYLLQLLPLLLGANSSDLSTLLDSDSFQENALKWANDVNAGVVYIVKSRIILEEVTGMSSPPFLSTSLPRMLMFVHNYDRGFRRHHH